MHYRYKKKMFPFLILTGLFMTANQEINAQTCLPRSVPYIETFDTLTEPALPPCSDTLNLDGDSRSWKTQNVGVSPKKANLRFRNENPSINEGWFFTEGIHLEKDSTYTFYCLWLAAGRAEAPRIKIHWGTDQHPDSMYTTPLLDNNHVGQSPYDTLKVDFTPTRTGTHYIGLYGYGDDAKTIGIDINVDNIVVARKGAVLQDISVTSIMDFSAAGEICTDTNADLTVVITNTGIIPLENILVDIMYTGPATGARSATITGPLEMGASDTVVFANTDLSLTGQYDFTATILTAFDEVADNDTLELSITVVTDPKADSILVTAGGGEGVFNFEAVNAENASRFEWDFGDGNTADIPSPTHTYTQSGVYNVSLTISNACGDITLSSQAAVEIEEDDENGIFTVNREAGVHIYPNPARDKVMITPGTGNTIQQVSILNSAGISVYSYHEITGPLQVDTKDMAAGIYLIRIKTDYGIANYKLQVLD